MADLPLSGVAVKAEMCVYVCDVESRRCISTGPTVSPVPANQARLKPNPSPSPSPKNHEYAASVNHGVFLQHPTD